MAFSLFTKTATVSNADWNDNDEDDGYDDASSRMKLSDHTYVRAEPANCFGNAEVSAVRWKEERMGLPKSDILSCYYGDCQSVPHSQSCFRDPIPF